MWQKTKLFAVSRCHVRKRLLEAFQRQLSDLSRNTTMQAWQLFNYGEALSLSSSVPLPAIMAPNDVLIKVHAASVNPFDCRMKGKK